MRDVTTSYVAYMTHLIKVDYWQTYTNVRKSIDPPSLFRYHLYGSTISLNGINK
ncbi:hypothetical protein OUHCRE17_15450 [Enterobacter hormaechei subsp. steigerwaltii]